MESSRHSANTCALLKNLSYRVLTMEVDREVSLETRKSLLEVTGKSRGCVRLGATAQGQLGTGL